MASRRRIRQRFALASQAAHNHRLRRRPALEALESRVLLSTFTVKSIADTGSGSNDTGDLRYCITQANANNQANTIVFDSNVFSFPQTITLVGSPLELNDTGGTQTITGPAAGVIITGGQKSGVFDIDANVTASLSGLTITGGSDASGGGGGVYNRGNVTLTDCTVSGNSAFYGGGIDNRGNVTLTDCAVSDNTAFYGGGIDNDGTTATLTGTTVSGNSAVQGGGIDNYGNATLTDCAVSGNSAVQGGGIETGNGSLTITTTTISGNKVQGSAGKDGTTGAHGTNAKSDIGGKGGIGGVGGNGENAAGGGLYVAAGTVDLTNSTLSDNTAAGGAGGTGGKGGIGGKGGDGDGEAGFTSRQTHVSGFSGGRGGTGGPGGTGGEGFGGGLYVGGGTLSVLNTTIAGNEANGGLGGLGGLGGVGGVGGTAAKEANGDFLGAGGAGGAGGEGGVGGVGGEGNGGGVYLAGGAVTLQYTTIAIDQVSSGQEGAGGAGATGGLGGSGNPNGSKGGNGSSGPSGNVGSASGGGIDTSILANLGSTIVATNTNEGQPSDVLGELDPKSSNNLFGNGGSGGLTNGLSGNIVLSLNISVGVADAGLTALGDYGGPTQTMALRPGSPAIGAGGVIGLSSPTIDQRGFPRPLGSISDIGAYQTGFAGPLVVTETGDGRRAAGELDMRGAFDLANLLGDATFSFDPTIFATHQTIRLTAGQLDLSETSGLLTFDGPAAGLTIDAGGKSGVFLVEPGVTAALSGLTLTGGSAQVGGGLENFGTVDAHRLHDQRQLRRQRRRRV